MRAKSKRSSRKCSCGPVRRSIISPRAKARGYKYFAPTGLDNYSLSLCHLHQESSTGDGTLRVTILKLSL